MGAVSIPLRAISHEISELEFHLSPALSSSRPHTGVGTCGTSSRIRVAHVGSSLRREWTVDGLIDVWDAPSAPAADFIAEQARPPKLLMADGAFGNNAAFRGALVPHGRHHDDVGRWSELDFARGVVQLAPTAASHSRRAGFEDPPVDPDAVPPGTDCWIQIEVYDHRQPANLVGDASQVEALTADEPGHADGDRGVGIASRIGRRSSKSSGRLTLMCCQLRSLNWTALRRGVPGVTHRRFDAHQVDPTGH